MGRLDKVVCVWTKKKKKEEKRGILCEVSFGEWEWWKNKNNFARRKVPGGGKENISYDLFAWKKDERM